MEENLRRGRDWSLAEGARVRGQSRPRRTSNIEVKKGIFSRRPCFTALCGWVQPLSAGAAQADALGILWPDLACPPYPGV